MLFSIEILKYILTLYILYLVYMIIFWGFYKLDFRKIIKFGNSSFVVSLPMNWVKKNKLKKGDTIYISEDSNNGLVFSSKLIEREEESKEVVLDITGKSIDQIEMELVAAYINHCDVVNLISKDLKSNVVDVREMVNKLIGFEITHQLPGKIIIKDFLNLNDVSLSDMIRKIDLMIRSMFDNLVLCFNKKESVDVQEQDIDVNKLSFLILRVVKKALDDPELGKKMGMSNLELSETRILVTKLEKIADSLKRIYRFWSEADINEAKKFNLLFLKLKDSYFKVMDSYYMKDYKKAYEVASSKSGYMLECEKFFEKKNSVNTIKLVERLKEIQAYVADVARIAYMREE